MGISLLGRVLLSGYDWVLKSFSGMYSAPTQDDTTRVSLCALKSPGLNTTFSAGYVSNYQSSIPGSVTENICCGADVSVPDMSIAYQVGGLVSGTTLQPLTYPYPTRNYTSSLPKVVEASFWQCQLSGISGMTCMYRHVPEGLPPRAEAGLIWIPYGVQGSLVLIGGTTRPADLQLTTTNTSNLATFNLLTDIWVYDIGSDVWHNQSTSTAPGHELPAEMASFCSVVVGTADGKNQHIYVYGGYDPTAENITTSDQVWILVLPSFKWVLAAQGNPQHRRQNHKCVLPSPTQMISIGGMVEGGMPLQGSILDLFNLNTLEWTSTYNGSSTEPYIVPDSIVAAVGGTQDGGVEIPKDIRSEVAQLFSNPYQGMVSAYYPYTDCNPNNNSTSGNGPESFARRLGLPDWMGAVLAISLSLFLSLWAVLALVALRRRTYIRGANMDTSIIESNSAVVRWMHNAPSAHEKGIQKSAVTQRDSFTPLKLAYVDEEEVPESTTAGKSTSSSIGTYERSFLDENGEIELRTFLGPEHTRPL